MLVTRCLYERVYHWLRLTSSLMESGGFLTRWRQFRLGGPLCNYDNSFIHNYMHMKTKTVFCRIHKCHVEFKSLLSTNYADQKWRRFYVYTYTDEDCVPSNSWMTCGWAQVIMTRNDISTGTYADEDCVPSNSWMYCRCYSSLSLSYDDQRKKRRVHNRCFFQNVGTVFGFMTTSSTRVSLTLTTGRYLCLIPEYYSNKLQPTPSPAMLILSSFNFCYQTNSIW